MSACSVDRVVTGSTRRGTPLRFVREHYLRDDVVCGSEACQRGCTPTATPALAADATHYVLPDLNALEDYWDIWELQRISGLIVLSTALRWV